MIGEVVPVLGVLTGLVVPVAAFFWLYHEEKGKREAVIEIAKHLDDPGKIEELLTIFDERKKNPNRLSAWRRDHLVCWRRYLSVWASVIRCFF